MFQIFVDSAANLPAVIAKKYNIHVISFVNLISGKEVTCYNPDLSPEEERQKGTEYYNCLLYTSSSSVQDPHNTFRSAKFLK